MRKYAKSWVSSIFLGGLALSFAVWGIADIFKGSADTNVFTLGATQVPVDQFARDYHNAMRNAGTTLPPDQAKVMGQQVLDRMTLGIALDNLAASLGLTASDARVRQQIQAIQAFNGPLGGFDHDTFLRVIGQAQYSEDEFVAVSRKDAARGQMLRAVEGGYRHAAGLCARDLLLHQRSARRRIRHPDAGVARRDRAAQRGGAGRLCQGASRAFSTPEYREVESGLDRLGRRRRQRSR